MASDWTCDPAKALGRVGRFRGKGTTTSRTWREGPQRQSMIETKMPICCAYLALWHRVHALIRICCAILCLIGTVFPATKKSTAFAFVSHVFSIVSLCVLPEHGDKCESIGAKVGGVSFTEEVDTDHRVCTVRSSEGSRDGVRTWRAAELNVLLR